MDQKRIRRNHNIRRNDGAALITVMIVLIILSVFIAVISTILMTNLNEAKYQENYVRAYYLAESGTDLCLAALLQEGIGGSNDTLLYKQYSVTAKPNIATTPTLTDTMALTGGTVNITVHAITVDGERWVEITSLATLTGTGITKTVTLQFQVSNPLVQKRS